MSERTDTMPRAAGVSLAISVDPASSVPLPDQIVTQFRVLIAEATLRPGEPIPSSRRLASHLGVSRGTVETAFAQLTVEGYLVSRERSATRVNPQLPAALTARPAGSQSLPVGNTLRQARSRLIDLRPGHGGGDPVKEPVFRRAWREALDADPGPIDPLGQAAARWAIADHLRLLRGMSVDPDDIVITSGSRDGLRLIFTAGLPIKSGQGESIGVENPGFPGLRLAMSDQTLVPFDVSQGVSAGALTGLETEVSAIILTPNHQFPHGSTMPVEARTRILDWAASNSVLVIEDDYDSEARNRRTVVPTLYELASGMDAPPDMVHIGTFSTLLTSAVSSGYVLARGPIAAKIKETRISLGPAVAPVLQGALANYLDSGGLRRRIARARRRMRAAEEVLSDVLETDGGLPGLVHEDRTLVIETDEALADHLIRVLADHGIRVASLAAGWSGDGQVRHGIVIAHSNVEAPVLRRALTLVGDLLRHSD